MRLSAEEFADVFEAFHDIGGGGEFRCDGVLRTEYFFGEFFDESVFVAVFIDDDEFFDVGIGLGVGHLYGEVKEVDAFIDFVVRAGECFGGDEAGVGHFGEHALDLAGFHHFAEE